MTFVNVTYLGDEEMPSSLRDDPVTIDGIAFLRGKAVRVEAARVNVAKLRSNPYFSVEDEDRPVLKVPDKAPAKG